MKVLLAGLLMIAVLPLWGKERRAPLCFDGDTEQVFAAPEMVAFDATLATKRPNVVLDKEGRSKLEWVALGEAEVMTEEKIGSYEGRGIFRFVCRKREAEKGAREGAFLWVVYGLQEDTGRGVGFRPFFVMSGETLRWTESTLDFAQGRMTLSIHKTVEGSGMYWTDFVFAFDAAGARIAERSAGGRRMATTFYTYDEQGEGRVVKTVEVEEN